MSSFGPRLKRERELRGVTLDDIAESTKIGKRSLQALEDENFNQLPGGIFNKGFVRAYAKYLGINEEQAVADFLEAESAAATGKRSVYVEPVVEKLAEAPGAKSEKPKSKAEGDEKPAKSKGGGKKQEANEPPLNPDPTANRIWMAAAILLLIGIFFAWRALTRHSNDEAPKQEAPAGATAQPALSSAPATAVQTDLPANPGAQGAADTGTATPAPAAGIPSATDSGGNAKPATNAPNASSASEPVLASGASSDGVVIQVQALEDSWVQITSDGKVVMDGVMLAKTEREFRGNANLVMKTGNAGGIQVSQNGKTYGIMGKEKQVRTVTFSAKGIQP